MKYLIADGLFPQNSADRKALEQLDPFALRAAALLDQPLSLAHMGRAIWHLNQRRGFKSNRKTDKPDDDTGKIKVGIGRLEEAMASDGAATLGQWLHMRRQPTPDHPDGLTVRTRLRPEEGPDAKGKGYDFYPGRALIEEEFDAIWAAQMPHHSDVLTPEVRDRLYEIVFRQRPLKTLQVGTCTFGNGEPRLPKAHPLFQRRRLLEEVNALKFGRTGEMPQRLTPDQRDAILLIKPDAKAKISFDKMRRALKLDSEVRFNKESENRDAILGDEVAVLMGTKTRFGNRWAHLSPDEQIEVVSRLQAVESDADVAGFSAWLSERFALSPELAGAVVSARLPQGYGRFGESVTRGLIDELANGRNHDDQVIVYSEAVERLGLHHSDFRTKNGVDLLPYYGSILERYIMPGTGDPSDSNDEKRIGRLTNPTVHIGLNQLRRTVNRLIEHFGRPTEIAIELARELKLTEEEKKRRNRENNENRLAAEKRAQKLQELGQHNTGANRALLKLWEELDGNCIGRQCVYTGRIISPTMLFTDQVEVDHILPFKATLDDSNANKIVCVKEVNRRKRKRSPWDAWGGTDAWDEIAARANRLPRNKRWRFDPDAMQQHRDESGFLDRHLVDTQHLGRMAHQYLMALYPKLDDEEPRQGPKSPVWLSRGSLTALFRHAWGLDNILRSHNQHGGKNRDDHRHHAVDAITIALVDRRMIQHVSTIAASFGAEYVDRAAKMIALPWPEFREDAERIVNAIVVSHRPDHGTAGYGNGSTAGRLHNDTAYGLTGDAAPDGRTPIVVHRVPLTSLKPDDLMDPSRIPDETLRDALYEATRDLTGKEFENALKDFSQKGGRPDRNGQPSFKGIRHVRVREPLNIIPIRNRQGHVYKGYKGDSNYRYDIWEMPDGKWRADVVSMFDAHQPGERGRPHPAARRLMRLHRDDILAIERTEGVRELVRVVKFSEKQFAVAPPNEGGALKARDADKNDPFKYIYPAPSTLKAWRTRKVGVDETGRVRDPGPNARTRRRATRPRPTA